MIIVCGSSADGLRYTDTPEFLVNDPYRCYWFFMAATWVSVIAVLVVLPAYLGYALVSQSLAPSSPTQIQPSIFPHWNNHQVLKIEALLAGGRLHSGVTSQSSIVLPGLALLSQIPNQVSRE